MKRNSSRFVATLATSILAIGIWTASAHAGIEELSPCNSLDRVETRPTGQILGVGTTSVCDDSEARRRVVVIQVDAQGQLDPAFGSGGLVVLPETVAHDEKPELELLAGGRAIVGTPQAFVALTPDGRPDPAFGGDGRITMDFGITPEPSEVEAGQFAVNADGSLIVHGFTRSEGYDFRMMLARFTPAGELDDSFGDEGLVEVENGAQDLKIGPGGLIYTASSSSDGDLRIPSVTRYTPDGELDPTYGSAETGTALVDPVGITPTMLLASDLLVIEPSGRATVSGSMLDGTFKAFARRLDPDGLPQQFDLPGRLVTAIGSQGDILSINGPRVLDLIRNEQFNVRRDTSALATVGGVDFMSTFGAAGASDAQFDGGGTAFAGGSVDTCYNGCGSSFAFAKLGTSPSGLDDTFGANNGVAAFPAVGCGMWPEKSAPFRSEACDRSLGTYPMEAEITFGQSRKPGAVVESVLPGGTAAAQGRERTVVTQLPRALKLRRKRPDLVATLDGQRVPLRSIRYADGAVSVRLTNMPWSAGSHRLMVKARRGSYFGLGKRQRFRKLNFSQSLFFRYADTSEESAATGTKTKPVAKKRKKRRN